jgi:hypothetical protein
MNTKVFFSITLALVVLSISCSKKISDNIIVIGSGVLTTEVRALPSFHSIELRTVASVELTYDTLQEVSVTVDNNVLQHITTAVNSEVLVIDVAKGVQLSNFDLTLDLHMTDLEGLTVSSVGLIQGQNLFQADSVSLALNSVGSINLQLEADLLTSSVSSVGTLTLGGLVDKHLCTDVNVGTLHAFDLAADTSDITLNSSGNAEVLVSDLLTVVINGSGSLYYKGNPTIMQTINGSGTVIDAN